MSDQELAAAEALLAADETARAVAVHQSNGPAVAQPEGDGLLAAIVQMARDKSVDVTKLEALMAMQERLENRQSVMAFEQAFSRLQAKLPRLRKNGVLEYPVNKNQPDGPKRKIASYVKFDDLHEAIQPLLSAEGFGVSFRVEPRQGDGGGLLVTCLLKHSAGHTMEGATVPMPLDTSGGKNNAQGYASALSYGKRHAITATLNLSAEGEDDDGVRAGTQFLTPEQVDEIEKLIEEAKADRAVFLQRFFEATDVANLPAEQYVPCKNMLLARVQARQRGTTAGE